MFAQAKLSKMELPMLETISACSVTQYVNIDWFQGTRAVKRDLS